MGHEDQFPPTCLRALGSDRSDDPLGPRPATASCRDRAAVISALRPPPSPPSRRPLAGGAPAGDAERDFAPAGAGGTRRASSCMQGPFPAIPEPVEAEAIAAGLDRGREVSLGAGRLFLPSWQAETRISGASGRHWRVCFARLRLARDPSTSTSDLPSPKASSRQVASIAGPLIAGSSLTRGAPRDCRTRGASPNSRDAVGAGAAALARRSGNSLRAEFAVHLRAPTALGPARRIARSALAIHWARFSQYRWVWVALVAVKHGLYQCITICSD
jgi:hypothetical protein